MLELDNMLNQSVIAEMSDLKMIFYIQSLKFYDSFSIEIQLESSKRQVPRSNDEIDIFWQLKLNWTSMESLNRWVLIAHPL